MKKQLFLCISLWGTLCTQAQVIAEVKGITFYEHHSSDMTGRPFGSDANGSKSGYDFVHRKYINSFDANTFDAYQNGEEKDIDMVEHDGPFGTNGSSMYLGFTSGISTIWNGDIKGNATTKWHKVTGGVNVYDSLTDYPSLKRHYNAALAMTSVAEVKKDEVYIGRIRNTDLYVMIRCTAIKLSRGRTDIEDNSAFLFDYKFGTEKGVTGMKEETYSSLDVYPNPTQGNLFIQSEYSTINPGDMLLIDMTGKQITIPQDNISIHNKTIQLNTDFLSNGLYTIVLRGLANAAYSTTFLKTDN